METRQILITGPGLGKTLLASLLANHYGQSGFSHEVIHVGSRREAEGFTSTNLDFRIVVSNDMFAIENPWKTITVSGGQFVRDAR